jgi:hypothetical protein
MTISLASAWHPRGELGRLERLVPQLRETYSAIAISLPPGPSAELVQALLAHNISVAVTSDWAEGRHAALQAAANSGAEFIHSCDFDRLVHWVETRPTEWRAITTQSQTTDCLVVGRTTAAYQTHPRALIETEAISNAVVSYLVGRRMDVSAGSKSFSRRAADYILQHSPPGFALGMDAEWVLMLHQAGMRIDYVEAHGLDWESADRYAEAAADRTAQLRAAAEYDADPLNWARRVQVAMEIVQRALAVSPLQGEG